MPANRQRSSQQALPAPIALRLSANDMRLEAYLASEPADTAAFVALIREQSAALHVSLPLNDAEIAARLPSWRVGEWNQLASATPPGQTVNGRVELLVPVPVASRGDQIAGGRHSVRAGTALARLKKGTRGASGHDLLGRELHARPPREPQLP